MASEDSDDSHEYDVEMEAEEEDEGSSAAWPSPANAPGAKLPPTPANKRPQQLQMVDSSQVSLDLDGRPPSAAARQQHSGDGSPGTQMTSTKKPRPGWQGVQRRQSPGQALTSTRIYNQLEIPADTAAVRATAGPRDKPLPAGYLRPNLSDSKAKRFAPPVKDPRTATSAAQEEARRNRERRDAAPGSIRKRVPPTGVVGDAYARPNTSTVAALVSCLSERQYEESMEVVDKSMDMARAKSMTIEEREEMMKEARHDAFMLKTVHSVRKNQPHAAPGEKQDRFKLGGTVIEYESPRDRRFEAPIVSAALTPLGPPPQGNEEVWPPPPHELLSVAGVREQIRESERVGTHGGVSYRVAGADGNDQVAPKRDGTGASAGGGTLVRGRNRPPLKWASFGQDTADAADRNLGKKPLQTQLHNGDARMQAKRDEKREREERRKKARKQKEQSRDEAIQAYGTTSVRRRACHIRARMGLAEARCIAAHAHATPMPRPHLHIVSPAQCLLHNRQVQHAQREKTAKANQVLTIEADMRLGTVDFAKYAPKLMRGYFQVLFGAVNYNLQFDIANEAVAASNTTVVGPSYDLVDYPAWCYCVCMCLTIGSAIGIFSIGIIYILMNLQTFRRLIPGPIRRRLYGENPAFMKAHPAMFAVRATGTAINGMYISAAMLIFSLPTSFIFVIGSVVWLPPLHLPCICPASPP